ncbi:MAG: flagellar biosynthesis protein FlhB [bacterium]
MAESETGQERTEEATPKRERDAKKKGQVARSKELNTALVLLAGSGSLILMGGHISKGIVGLIERAFTFDAHILEDTGVMLAQFESLIFGALWELLPLFTILLLSTIVGPALLGGLNFSTKSIAFKAEKLNPLKGLKNIFSLKALLELAKTLAKFMVIGLATLYAIQAMMTDLMQLGQEVFPGALYHALAILVWGFFAFSSTLWIIAAVDVPFQLWQHSKQLKMTRQEVKDEMKDTEGRPEVKSRIRQVQQELSQQRMMQDVPKADVIVTNPTHYAVALKYKETDSAPIVIAKGRGIIAAQIRKIGDENEIQRIEAPPLARALYSSAKIGQVIPQDLFKAVAIVLAYVFQLKTLDPSTRHHLKQPADIPVPSYYDENFDVRENQDI